MIKIKDKDGNYINAELTEKSDKDIFILFHGMFGDRKTSGITITEEFLLERGYSVLSFDFPGHGDSYGNLNDMTLKDIFNASGAALNHARDYENIYLLGFSFGANPVIHLASKNDRIKGAVLFNPASNMLELIFRKSTMDDLDNYDDKHRDVPLTTKIRFFFECLGNNNYRLAKNIKCPVYMYHIKNDISVPVKQSIRLSKSLRKCFLESPIGSDHAMDPEMKNGKFKNEILPKAVDWVEKN